jgi:hypothetical protein
MYTKKTLRYSAANDRHGRRNIITCFWSHKKNEYSEITLEIEQS